MIRSTDCCTPDDWNSLTYWLAEVAAPSLAKMPAVFDTAAASAALAATAWDGIAMPRSCAADVLRTPAALRSSAVTQFSLPLHACALDE